MRERGFEPPNSLRDWMSSHEDVSTVLKSSAFDQTLLLSHIAI